MKQKVMFITIVLLALSNTIILYNYCNLKKEVLSYKENYKKSKKNMISMMLETYTNSKTYIQSTDSTWPSDGYVFNVEMSKCEQGSTLKWDEENKKVVMEGNTSDKCYVFFDKYSPIKINNYSITSSGNKITITIDASSGTGTISKYYYSKDDGVTYIESTSNNYVFTSLDKGTYKIKAYVEDSNGKKSSIVSKTVEIINVNLVELITSKYTGTQGENGIYYHGGRLTNSALDNSYRYSGLNPDNYICFGSEEPTCPANNLYRIIGVFEENNHGVSGKKLVKIIKNDSYGTYEWHKKSGNDWSIADLNKTLNSTFLTAQLSGYEDKIQSVAWKISGLGNESGVAKGIYTVEVANATKTYEAKVGLMYLSDYAYASSPSYWETSVFKYTAEVVATNWLYLDNKTQWVLTRASTDNYDVFSITNDGYVNGDNNTFSLYEVKPTFYLISDILYAGGTGTLTDPYRTR